MGDEHRNDGREPASNVLSGSVVGPVLQARTVGDVHVHHHRSARRSAPAQLPVTVRSFFGRDEELAVLRTWCEETTGSLLLVVLTGPAGVGKTSLAARWLQPLQDAYPGGTLFASLRGATEAPTSPSEVLEWFLVSLGHPAKKVPMDSAQRQALFRSLTASQKVIVVLDDAASAAQVRPLLPAGGSLLVVTSRYRLSGLLVNGARWLNLAPLGQAAALQVLSALVGHARVAAEPEAATTLTDLCAGLPLALAVAGARLAMRPHRQLAQEVSALQRSGDRLAGLETDDVSVEAVLDGAYTALDDDGRTLYRACAHHPGLEFGIDAVAATVGWPVERAGRALETLVLASLVGQHDDGRFHLHDLLRVHGRLRSATEDVAAQRDAMLLRTVEWYLDRSVEADLVIHPLRPRVGPRYARSAGGSRFTTQHEALTWLERERANIRASVHTARDHEWHDLVWQLCEALWGFFLHTRHYDDWLVIHRLGIDSAVRCGHRAAQARMHAQLAFAYAKLRNFDDAAEQSRRMLDVATAEGDEHAQASALSSLGRAARETGDLTTAVDCFRRSQAIRHRLRRWRGVALCRRRIGDVLARLGRHQEAIIELTAAVTAMRELGDDTQHARALMFLGASYLRIGRPDLASGPLLDALTLMRGLGSPYYQAEILAQLGTAAQQSADAQAAHRYYAAAQELYSSIGDPQADVIRTRLASL